MKVLALLPVPDAGCGTSGTVLSLSPRSDSLCLEK